MANLEMDIIEFHGVKKSKKAFGVVVLKETDWEQITNLIKSKSPELYEELKALNIDLMPVHFEPFKRK